MITFANIKTSVPMAGFKAWLPVIFFVLGSVAVPAVSHAEGNFTLDVDGDGQQAPLTDGVLIIRHLFGFTGDALTEGAVGEGAARSKASEISTYLSDNLPSIDVDQNGVADPLSDGLIVIRYLFGFTDSALVEGAAAVDGLRTSSNDVKAYLDAMISAQDFFDQSVSGVILEKCLVCHQVGGVAGGTPLRYVADSDDDFLALNFNVLQAYIAAGNGARLLSRARGVNHGGGAVLSSATQGYRALDQFVGLVQAEAGLTGEIKAPVVAEPTGLFKTTQLLSARSTLRRASILLLGRNPTVAEYDQLEEESLDGLRRSLELLTRDPAFHEFLIRSANDRLLTDAFLEGPPIEQSSIESNGNYPVATNAFVDAQAAAGERHFRWPKYDHWRWGLTRAPLELIAYVVGNDRDYREVLTADYMMVNYAVNDFLNAGAVFDAADAASLPYCLEDPSQPCVDFRVYKPGKNNGQAPRDENLEFEQTDFQSSRVVNHTEFFEYPHAGVLTTQAFLNRYPSTETNRNRARARWTYQHFLGVDIEKSAPRTTDPVALADVDHPTLRNPACTVCHQVLDPVAGAFEHFGDIGYYNESWGGLDALPDNYKRQNGDPSFSTTYAGGETVTVSGEESSIVSGFSATLDAGSIYYKVSFDNDAGGPDGDRNVFFDRLVVTGPTQGLVVEFESLPEDTITLGCGHETDEGYGQFCAGYVLVPLELSESGQHLFELQAQGQQYGDADVQLTVSIDTNQGNAVQTGYVEGDTWYKDMRAPGYLTGAAPDESDSLQWTAKEIVADPWFAEAAVKFWWPAVMGEAIVAAPEVETDVDFQERLAVFEAQNDFVVALGADFAQGIDGGSPFNGRDLILKLLESPWFRADSAESDAVNLSGLGTRRLLTPEELEAKFKGISGFYWGGSNHFSEWQIDARHTSLVDEFKVLYGGIDSKNVTRRSEQMTAIMFNIAEKMALATACQTVVGEFQQPQSERRLFTKIERETSPFSRSLGKALGFASSTSFNVAIEYEAQLEIGAATVEVSFVNDYSDDSGDRSAQFDRLTVRAPDGAEQVIEFEALPEGHKISGCGHGTDSYYQLSCGGTISVPISIAQSGNHVFTLTAAGEQAGDEAVAIELSVIETSASEPIGMPELKSQLALMHWDLLGEPIGSNEAEIDASYALLLESYERIGAQEHRNFSRWPYQTCANTDWQNGHLDTDDPNGMKGAWISVLTYLMTDFRFLHE